MPFALSVPLVDSKDDNASETLSRDEELKIPTTSEQCIQEYHTCLERHPSGLRKTRCSLQHIWCDMLKVGEELKKIVGFQEDG